MSRQSRRWVRSLVGGALVFAGITTVRARLLRWGASDDELSVIWPGDELLPAPNLTATRSVTIAAPLEEVWPWIVQIGQGRGGFYTYDWLENLVGADIHSARTVLPEFQHPGIGDDIRLAPEMALRVAEVDPPRALVLRGGTPTDEGGPPYDFTWAFTLSPRPDGSTRLVIRERYAYTRWWVALMVEPIEVISFVMTQRMLRGIKERAERTTRASGLFDA